jgi:cytochrome c-type protein NapC
MSAMSRIWQAIRGESRSSVRILVRIGVAILVVTALGGAVIAGASATLHATSTESFCISCHEMKTHAYGEFKDTIHDKNRSGVRATCSDCHVPREVGPMLVRKVESLREVYGHFTGMLDTPEKYEKHRYEMAKRVWIHMKETDSRECRNCHTESGVSAELQSDRAKSRHEKGRKEGLTCIDCHAGIAHKEPDGPGPAELKVAK